MLANPPLHNWWFLRQDVFIYVASVFAMAVYLRTKSAKLVALLKPMRSRALRKRAAKGSQSLSHELYMVQRVGSSHGIPDRL